MRAPEIRSLPTLSGRATTDMNQDEGDESALAAIRRACGTEVASRLVEAFAGLKVFIPGKPNATSKLAEYFDTKTLQQLSDVAGGEHILIPIGSRNAIGQMRARVRQMLLAGLPAREIVQSAGCAVRTVFKVKAAMREAGELQPKEPDA